MDPSIPKSKEEEDNAWWSDYQASTKLKRKWKTKDNEQDNLDDLLSDLDTISQAKEIKPGHSESSLFRSNSRQSSTSGYDTLSSLCTTPDIRDASESLTEIAIDNSSRCSTPHAENSLSYSRSECDIMIKDETTCESTDKGIGNKFIPESQTHELALIPPKSDICDAGLITLPPVTQESSHTTRLDTTNNECLSSNNYTDTDTDNKDNKKEENHKTHIKSVVPSNKFVPESQIPNSVSMSSKSNACEAVQTSSPVAIQESTDTTRLDITNDENKFSNTNTDTDEGEIKGDIRNNEQLVSTEKVVSQSSTLRVSKNSTVTSPSKPDHEKDTSSQGKAENNEKVIELNDTSALPVDVCLEKADSSQNDELLAGEEENKNDNTTAKDNLMKKGKVNKKDLNADLDSCKAKSKEPLKSENNKFEVSKNKKTSKTGCIKQNKLFQNEKEKNDNPTVSAKHKVSKPKLPSPDDSIVVKEPKEERIDQTSREKQILTVHNLKTNDAVSDSEAFVVKAQWSTASISDSSTMVSHWISQSLDMKKQRPSGSELGHIKQDSHIQRMDTSQVIHKVSSSDLVQKETSMLTHCPVNSMKKTNGSSSLIAHSGSDHLPKANTMVVHQVANISKFCCSAITGSMVAHHANAFQTKSIKPDCSMVPHQILSHPTADHSMVAHHVNCESPSKQNKCSPMNTNFPISLNNHWANCNATTMVAHMIFKPKNLPQNNPISSVVHTYKSFINHRRPGSTMVSHQLSLNINNSTSCGSMLSHVVVHTKFGSYCTSVSKSCANFTSTVSWLSMLAHIVSLKLVANQYVPGTLIPHQFLLHENQEFSNVSSVCHFVNACEDKNKQPGEVNTNKGDTGYQEIDSIACDVADDSPIITNTVFQADVTEERESLKQSADNCRTKSETPIMQSETILINEIKQEDSLMDAMREQTVASNINMESEQKVGESPKSVENFPHDSTVSSSVSRTECVEKSLVHNNNFSNTGMSTQQMSSGLESMKEKTTMNCTDEMIQECNISLQDIPSNIQVKNEEIQRSVSTTSLQSCERTEGENSSMNGSMTSLSSPLPTRKPRPLVLRNHFSNISHKQNEQKYLPAPRIRRSSEESGTKSGNTPQLKRKSKKEVCKLQKTEIEEQKQAQVGELHSRSEESDITKSNFAKSVTDKFTLPIPNTREEAALDEREKEKVSSLDSIINGFMNFEFKYIGNKSSVQVAGSFNNWIPEDLLNRNCDEIWTKSIRLPHGTFEFKYLVDGVWMHDPLYPTVCSQDGVVNNIIYVGNKVKVEDDTVAIIEEETTSEEPIVGKIEIVVKDDATALVNNISRAVKVESDLLVIGNASETLVTKDADIAKTPHDSKDASQGLLNNIYESKIAPEHEQLPKEKAAAIEIRLTTLDSIVSDGCNPVENIATDNSNVGEVGCVEKSLVDVSLLSTHSGIMELNNLSGEDNFDATDLKKINNVSINSEASEDDLESKELIVNTLNENIKKLCLKSEYKNDDKKQLIIKEVLELMENASDSKDLHENITNKRLQIFLNPLSDADIENLCNKSYDEVKQCDLIITPKTQNKEESAEVNDKNQLKAIINENIRIVRKSPSFIHDPITQMSVQKVLEIMNESANEEELAENLQDLSLEFFTEPDKSKFWSLKDENLDSCITIKGQPSDESYARKESVDIEDYNDTEAVSDILEKNSNISENQKDEGMSGCMEKIMNNTDGKESENIKSRCGIVDKYFGTDIDDQNVKKIITDKVAKYVGEEIETSKIDEANDTLALNKNDLAEKSESKLTKGQEKTSGSSYLDYLASPLPDRDQTGVDMVRRQETSPTYLVNNTTDPNSVEKTPEKSNIENHNAETFSAEPTICKHNSTLETISTNDEMISQHDQNQSENDESDHAVQKEQRRLGQETDQVLKTETNEQKELDVEAYQKEQERVHLVGIINKNVSKFCKEKDYGKNETAQRKVRTLFNIITESVSAEEIYDRILLEGLHYFAEYHDGQNLEKLKIGEPKDGANEDGSSSATSNTEEKRSNSIVSKILKEVNTPKTNRKIDSVVSPKIKKSQTFAGDIRDENKEIEISGKCSITRDKASRQVKKYVRTSVSSVNLDQLDDSKSNNQDDPNNFREINITDKENTKSKDEHTTACKISETAVNEENYNTGSLFEKKDVPDSKFDEKENSPNRPKQTSISLKATLNEHEGTITDTDEQNKERTTSKETSGLSIENLEIKQKAQSVQRSFSEALKDSKEKRDNYQKKSKDDKNSIVSRFLMENRSNLDKCCDSKVKQETLLTNEVLKDSDVRDRTISECSDNLPDLCPILEHSIDTQPEISIDIDVKERTDKKGRSEVKEVNFSPEDPVECYEDSGRRNSIFMTDFDEVSENDSDNESFVDADDKIGESLQCDIMLANAEQKLRSVFENILCDVFDRKCCSCSSSQNFSSEEIDKVVKKLVTHILNLLEDCKYLKESEKSNTELLEKQDLQNVKDIENLIENTIDINCEEAREQFDTDAEVEVEECENVYDVFDLSMKRLDFIEHSFKSIYTTPTLKENDQIKEEVTEEKFEEQIKQIKDILKSDKGNEEKLKDIESIVCKSPKDSEK